jgi:multisubunit Na+/H+ antiporter MnhB subunit
VGRILIWCFTGLLLAALGILLLGFNPSVFTRNPPVPETGFAERMREYLFHRAVEESGAINLVSAIYLGYRSFDTLGETIVLVLSVAGVLLVTGVRQ